MGWQQGGGETLYIGYLIVARALPSKLSLIDSIFFMYLDSDS